MAELKKKIDFALVFSVRNANPNGDPLDGNRPRCTMDGLGEVSDVCLKRKLRNRLLDMGCDIFVQSDDRRKEGDTARSLRDRADSNEKLAACIKELSKKDSKMTREDYARIACESWYDVRAFGQVFAFKSGKKDEEGSVSVGIRGPVSIQPAFSLDPITIVSSQITKSVNLETQADPDKKASDTMGMKHRVQFGIYVTYGAINVQAASKTHFSEEDAAQLKEALRTLFRNDATSARPDGSMEVLSVVWWEHDCANGQYSSAKVHRTLVVDHETGEVSFSRTLEGLTPEVIEGE